MFNPFAAIRNFFRQEDGQTLSEYALILVLIARRPYRCHQCDRRFYASTGAAPSGALSRGAASAVFVDRRPDAVSLAKENLKIARRTVAKYRMQLKIEPSHIRKRKSIMEERA